MHDGNLAEWWGCGGLTKTDSLGRLRIPLVGLGMQDLVVMVLQSIAAYGIAWMVM